MMVGAVFTIAAGDDRYVVLGDARGLYLCRFDPVPAAGPFPDHGSVYQWVREQADPGDSLIVGMSSAGDVDDPLAEIVGMRSIDGDPAVD
jgi:hypothetical protein